MIGTSLFLILLTFVRINTSTNSTGILETDWNNSFTNKSCDEDNNYLSCMKKEFKNKSPQDVRILIMKFYNEKKEFFENKIKLDLIYSNVVNETFANLILNGEIHNLKNDSIKTEILEFEPLKSKQSELKNKFKDDLDVSMNEVLQLLKETIYYNDDNFYDFYNKNISIIVGKLKDEFYEEEFTKIFNPSFDSAYPKNNLKNLYEEATNEYDLVNQTSGNVNSTIQESQFNSFKKELIKWAPLIFLNYEGDNKDEKYPFLENSDNIELNLIQSTTEGNEEENITNFKTFCGVPMEENMYDKGVLHFIFDLNCINTLENNKIYYFARTQKNIGFTKYTNTIIFKNVYFTISAFKEEDNTIYPKNQNNKYIIPNNINHSYIEYSFDQQDFESKYPDNEDNLILNTYGSNDLRLIAYDEDGNIEFASENCIYLGNQSHSLLNDWNTHLHNLVEGNVDITNKTEISKNLPNHLKNFGKNYLNEKRSYFEGLITYDINIYLQTEIENEIKEQLKREILKTSSSSMTCNTDSIKTNEIFSKINNTIFSKHKEELSNLINECKTDVRNKLYINDTTFDSTYNEKLSVYIETFGPKLITSEIELLINKTLPNCIKDNYKSFITNQCDKANKILEINNNKHSYYSIDNDSSCFIPLKSDFLPFAFTLALKINQTNKNEEHCILTKNTQFFITTSLDSNINNSIQCELSMNSNMLNDNILFLNFKKGNCNKFPSPHNDKYYFGTNIQFNDIITYYQQFIFPNINITYHPSNPIDNGDEILHNFTKTSSKCFLPKILQFKDNYGQNLHPSPTYVEYTFDKQIFTFENMLPQHKLPFQNSNSLTLLIHNNGTLIFAANDCEYKGELICSDCKNHKECIYEHNKMNCVCKDGFYGETCEEQTSNETIMKDIDEKLYHILNDEKFIVDINNNVASLNANKVKSMKNLILLLKETRKNKKYIKGIANNTQINTLNSITENYLTNAKHDPNSIYLLALAINCNVLKLQRNQSPLRLIEEITESEELIKHKIEHLLHLGAVHSSTKDISNNTESDLEFFNNNIYIHQWTSKSITSALNKINIYNLTALDQMLLKCSNTKSNLQYTLAEIPKELATDIYNETYISNIISFNVKDIDNPSLELNCPNIKFNIPAKGMNISSHFKIDDNNEINIYDFNTSAFSEKCYRGGEFDFDFTAKIKKDIINKQGLKVISSNSKNCYPYNYDEKNEKAIMQCSFAEKDLMVSFRVYDYNNTIESGSIFECSTDIQNIERNIAFWIYLAVIILTLSGIIFYISLKYDSSNHDSIMNIESALDNDNLYQQSIIPIQIPQTERNIIDDNKNLGTIQSEQIEINQNEIHIQIQDNNFGKIFAKNFLELHPLINPFIPSLITPLSLRLAFFSFNFLNLFGFNAVFSTNDYLYDRYMEKDRNKFVFPIRDHFDKMISAIVCTMGMAVVMRVIVIVTYARKEKLREDIQNKMINRNEVITEFRKEMIVSRSVCGFVMMIIIVWFFYFSVAWCNRYPKAQHSWGDACAWCLMFNYILFATVYIIIISAVQVNVKCEKCAYYMKRMFMF